MRTISFAASLAIVAMIGGGCKDKPAESTPKSTTPAQTTPATPTTPPAATTPVTPVTPPAATTPARPAQTTPPATTPATPPATATPAKKDGPTLFRTCVACHGAKADKPGMNKGRPPATMSKDEIVTALKGYKAGTNNAYGTGALMKGNMAPFSEQDIETVAAHIKTLK
jgi:cytochrome c